MFGSKGQVWSEYMLGLFVIFAVTVLYIILNQVYEANLYPNAIEDGVDSTNLNWIDTAWEIWPIPVAITVLFSIIQAGRRQAGSRSPL